MKRSEFFRNMGFLAVFIVLSLVLTSGSVLMAEEGGPAFAVERLVIAGSVEDKEPVGIVNMFPAVTEKVYCFLEARNIVEDTMISFVWYHNEDSKATVTLPLGKSRRWRTYSSKKLAGLKGDWKVELQDAEGNVVDSVTFSVE